MIGIPEPVVRALIGRPRIATRFRPHCYPSSVAAVAYELAERAHVLGPEYAAAVGAAAAVAAAAAAASSPVDVAAPDVVVVESAFAAPAAVAVAAAAAVAY